MKKYHLERYRREMEEQRIEKLEMEQNEKSGMEQVEKSKRFKGEGSRYLMNKYFSDKTIFGGNITTKDGDTKVSRFPGYRSYTNPAFLNEGSSSKSKATGNIFDVKKTIDGDTSKVSRFPGNQSHADPADVDVDFDNDSDTSCSLTSTESIPF